jgi:flagellar hook-associated protein 3 FlgL
MTVSTVSSSYLSGAMLPAVRQAQTQLATLEVESSTGQYADLGLQLGGQSGYELSLRTQDDLLQAITAGNGVTATNMSTAQNALSSILTAAQSAAQSLVEGDATANGPVIQQSLGQGNLQQLISLANTTTAGGYVFGGQNTGQAPINDYFSQPPSSARSAIDAAFQANFGFAVTAPQVANITAAQMQSFLAGPFAAQFQSPAWGANWSTASANDASSEISPGNAIETSTTTNTAGFQQLAQGYAMLTEFGDVGLSAPAQQALVSAATNSLSQGASSIIATQAQLGQSQSEVTAANSEMSTQMALLQTELSRSDSVDAAQVATELSTLSTQLETAYQLTAQIHNLNLAQYLPT